MGPQISKDKVPAYELIEQKINSLDGTIIVLRIYYMADDLSYRFHLIKNNRMCMVNIPKKVLEDLKTETPHSEEELTKILKSYLHDSSRWTKT
jgi:hypothetical protein